MICKLRLKRKDKKAVCYCFGFNEYFFMGSFCDVERSVFFVCEKYKKYLENITVLADI